MTLYKMKYSGQHHLKTCMTSEPMGFCLTKKKKLVRKLTGRERKCECMCRKHTKHCLVEYDDPYSEVLQTILLYHYPFFFFFYEVLTF